MEELEIDGELLCEVTERKIKKYWAIKNQSDVIKIVNYINANNPIARLLKEKEEVYLLAH